MKHYVVGYHDMMNNVIEICEYADDAFQALQQAKQDIPELKFFHLLSNNTHMHLDDL